MGSKHRLRESETKTGTHHARLLGQQLTEALHVQLNLKHDLVRVRQAVRGFPCARTTRREIACRGREGGREAAALVSRLHPEHSAAKPLLAPISQLQPAAALSGTRAVLPA